MNPASTPNTAKNTVETMVMLFSQIEAAVEKLNQCLEEEFISLKNNDSEQLINIAQQKQSLVAELGQAESARKKLTPSSITDKQEYLKWLDSLQVDGSLSQHWEKLSLQIRQCQKQNNTNSIISDKMAEATVNILGMLKGQSGTPQNTYTSTGKKTSAVEGLHNTTA